MMNDEPTGALQYQGVMISGTFSDLKRHHEGLVKALQKEELLPIDMANYVAAPGDDVISSSLKMVRKSSAYIGVISHRCGQVPGSATHNPHRYSISRLEFEEAQRLGLPTLIFVMSDAHPGTKADFEIDAEGIQTLSAYRERAKAGRIYIVFDSLEDFMLKAAHAVAGLRRFLKEHAEGAALARSTADPARDSASPDSAPIPAPPVFYAEPPYIGSHAFVGRGAQLDTLNEWASPANPHPVLLFEAIGGSGKSMLTWEWATKHATTLGTDWAGRFWYSFYERGAVMSDFCQRALAYITGAPLSSFRKQKTIELGDLLLQHLRGGRWLLVLDGLERVLVAYHRFDAAQLRDEQAGTADMIARRDPCAAIRPEDDHILQKLAGAAPSKLLLTSRLVPRILLNRSGQPIPGVIRVVLPGLTPPDAEALLRSCGVSGHSLGIQDYLRRHCNCHPLITGVLAGLINDYLPDRGNFDTWAADPDHGGKLELASLDLVQKRNHILNAALASLPDESRQLLSTIALLSGALDYPTLSAFNPHLPPAPTKVEEPHRAEERSGLPLMDEDFKAWARAYYVTALHAWETYQEAVRVWQESPEVRAAPHKLAEAVTDLERRGLLQYDPQVRRYDLHPVVRGIAVSGLRQEEKTRYGQRVVDHFSQQAHRPYEQAETLEDVRYGLHIVRTLLQMGRHSQAYLAYVGDLESALLFNVEGHAEILSLLRPLFMHGWSALPETASAREASHLANSAAIALARTGDVEGALAANGVSLLADLRERDWRGVRTSISSIAHIVAAQNHLARCDRYYRLGLDLAGLIGDAGHVFRAHLDHFRHLTRVGKWADGEATWETLDAMGRRWPRALYRSGDAELAYAEFRFARGELSEAQLDTADRLARAERNRPAIRDMQGLRGAWRLSQGRWDMAAESLHEAVTLARETGQSATKAEAQLALAKVHLKQLPDARHEAEQLASSTDPPDLVLAELWLAIGDPGKAKKHAVAALQWASSDGEPYVRRYELTKARALLEQIGATIPVLAPYDRSRERELPWERAVSEAVSSLRAAKGHARQ